MAIITSLATLRSAIADTLNRTDLSASGGPIDIFIQSAEQRFQRDPRVRDPANNAVLVSLHTTDPNWLLTGHPDIYLYGALVESAPYLKDDARVAVWEARYQEAVESLAGSVRLDPARSLALTTYAELQTLVADALNRGDIKNVIPVMITLAEKRLARDERVRNLETATFSVDADDEAVPSGFKHLESLAHDGSTYYGPLEIVGPDQIPTLKLHYGLTGAPQFAAILDGVIRFAPVPDQTYSLKMTYWRTITALASGVNWLYTAHPDIYLYATLCESKPWAAGSWDPEWPLMLEQRLNDMHQHVWSEQWSGTLRRQFRPIGG